MPLAKPPIEENIWVNESDISQLLTREMKGAG